jgi:hypothetical protein
MATTVTDRLGFKLQAAGDNPGTWEVDLNQGLQDAEDRFFLADAGDPNAEIHGGGSDAAMASAYIGQRYHDTDTDIWWTAQDAADPGTWVSDTIAQGLCTGVLEWLTISTLRLRPTFGNTLYIEIDGTQVPFVGALSWDMEADFFEGAEGASLPVYLYVENVAGVITPHLSGTVPQYVGDSKPGYHAVETSYRCIGSWWNGSGSDLLKGQMDRDGWLRFGYHDADHIYAGGSEITTTPQADYRSLTMNIPKTASNVLIHAGLANETNSTYLALAKSGAGVTALPSGYNDLEKLSAAGFEETVLLMQTKSAEVEVYGPVLVEIGIDNRAAPAIKYGTNLRVIDDVELVIMGYQDLWAPRGY